MTRHYEGLYKAERVHHTIPTDSVPTDAIPIVHAQSGRRVATAVE